MNDFDKYLKSKAREEQTEIPAGVKNQIERTLEALPEMEPQKVYIYVVKKIAAAAACAAFIMLFLLPNVSPAYAKAIEKIPVIGDIVRVVTIRNYFYSDNNHEMDISVPKIEGESGTAADYINKDVSELTTTLVNEFYRKLEIEGNRGFGSIHVTYETVTNTKRWFTLKLSVTETEASSNHYYEFYHIDKMNGKIIQLGDLFNTDDFSDILVAEITKQMQEQMDKDENVKYWVEDRELDKGFASVNEDHNFYWNDNGDLVIVFDKYEVAPGSMGTPEFVINKNIIKNILKPEYK